VRRSPQLGLHAAAVVTAAALVLAPGAGAGFATTGFVSLHVTTNGIVIVSPGHHTCARVCSLRLRLGVVVKVRASPRPHFPFSGWSGGCIGRAPTCVLAVDRSTSVHGAFVGEDETVTLAVSGPGGVISRPSGLSCGTGRSACTATFPWGTSLRFTAASAGGGRFVHWGGACSDVVVSACTLVVGSYGLDVTAAFAHSSPAPDPQRLTVVRTDSSEGFVVISSPEGIHCPTICEASFPPGTTVALSALPNATWSGDCRADLSPCSVIVDAPTLVVARPHFPQPPPPGYGVSVTVAGKGTVTAPGIKCGGAVGTLFDCESLFDRSARVVLTARPSKRSSFAGWNQFCSGKKQRCTLRVSAPMTVGAVFRKAPRR
jgi:hypothetical protein